MSRVNFKGIFNIFSALSAAIEGGIFDDLSAVRGSLLVVG